MSPDRPPQRGEVWWVAFDPSLGGEIRKTRPAVVVQQRSGKPGAQPRPGGAVDQQCRAPLPLRSLCQAQGRAAQGNGGSVEHDQQASPAGEGRPAEPGGYRSRRRSDLRAAWTLRLRRLTADPAVAPYLVLGRIQMLQCRVSLLRLPGEGRDPFPRWAPAFAGVTEFFWW